MRLKNLALAGAVVLLSAATTPGAALGQTAAPEGAALARRYVAALHLDRMMDSMMATMLPAMMDGYAKQNGGKVPDEVRSALTDAATESTRAMTPKMVDLMIPAIAESFTVPELQAAVNYYESPLAQSLLAKTPTYMAKLQPALVDLMPVMRADMQARACKKLGCDATAKK